MTYQPTRLENAAGLRVEINANGSVRRMDCGDIILNLFLGNELEGGLANIYLRRLGRHVASVPLLGPHSPAAVARGQDGFVTRGEWLGLRFTVSLTLPPTATAWFWQVEVVNAGKRPVALDLVYAQDIGIAHYGMVRLNEYYVSQYIDYTPLRHPEHGLVLAIRQNLAMGGRNPWAAIGSLSEGIGFATDALQLHDRSARAAVSPPLLSRKHLGSKRLQHEHSLATIQDAPLRLAPGESARRGFFGWFEADHPAATSAADLALVDKAIAVISTIAPSVSLSSVIPAQAGIHPDKHQTSGPMDSRLRGNDGGAEGANPGGATLFSHAPALPARDLTDAELTEIFGSERRHAEYRDGRLQSFFAGADTHVVLKEKELTVLRPHGHILRTGNHLTPDETSLTSTAWMDGVFNSMVTQGHVSINRFLSTTHSYLGLFRSHGQRLFVELAGTYVRLGVPSVFAMTPADCRWIYKHDAGLIEVRTVAATDRHEIALSVRVRRGLPCRCLVSHHVAMNGDDGAEAVPARWRRDDDAIVVSATPDSDVGRRFPEGTFRITATDGTVLEQVGGDELLFVDGVSRGQPFVVAVTAPALAAGFLITGQLVESGPPSQSPPVSDGGRGRIAFPPSPTGGTLQLSFPPSPTGGTLQLSFPPSATGGTQGGFAAAVQRLAEILPWLTHNALVHYLAPRGLEQYSGGGWGTRDVCQGPVEMLLALGEHAPVRDLLLRVFAAQNPDGDWPQWFMFFERERGIRPNDSHGDIVFWPVLALGRYLLASDDLSVLDERVPFFHGDASAAETAPVWDHVERALGVIAARTIPGTHLAAYGHGDWNDSLQPVDPAMRERLCSAWTVTLHHETLTTLAEALRVSRPQEAERLHAMTAPIRADFQRLLIADGVLTGFAYFNDSQQVDYLLHPRDDATGIHYRLLPAIHAILNGMLTPAQAKRHVAMIKKRLLGPDGARLFDRPPRYQGGPQRYFQRAESSTFFGREIGLMYMHAHLRYAQAMAYYGDAEAFFLALRQANPIALDGVVPTARPRQVNCYYSSSDPAFADRYEAATRYAQLRKGKVAFEGGWRVYSSGAGIMVRLIHECFLGLRRRAATLIIDPVMPATLDGLRAAVAIDGAPVTIDYRVGSAGCGPQRLTLNGIELSFERGPNPYRTGGAEVAIATLRTAMRASENRLTVHLS